MSPAGEVKKSPEPIQPCGTDVLVRVTGYRVLSYIAYSPVAFRDILFVVDEVAVLRLHGRTL